MDSTPEMTSLFSVTKTTLSRKVDFSSILFIINLKEYLLNIPRQWSFKLMISRLSAEMDMIFVDFSKEMVQKEALKASTHFGALSLSLP